MNLKELNKSNPYWLPKYAYRESYYHALRYKEFLKSERDRAIVIENTVRECTDDMYQWLLMGVTQEHVGYETLHTRGIPCSYNTYYNLRRKFYYLLSKKIGNQNTSE